MVDHDRAASVVARLLKDGSGSVSVRGGIWECNVNILPANTRLVQLVDGAGKRCLGGVSGGADVVLLLAAQLGFEFLFLAGIFCSPELQQFWRQWRQQLQESNSEIPTAPKHSAGVVKRAVAPG